MDKDNKTENALWDFISKSIVRESVLDDAPSPDIACCSSCGKEFDIADCPTESEGDWETGYYDVQVCPECPDGGCIDDYNMSSARADEYNEYMKKHNK